MPKLAVDPSLVPKARAGKCLRCGCETTIITVTCGVTTPIDLLCDQCLEYFVGWLRDRVQEQKCQTTTD
jgi:hypothetical protein